MKSFRIISRATATYRGQNALSTALVGPARPSCFRAVQARPYSEGPIEKTSTVSTEEDTAVKASTPIKTSNSDKVPTADNGATTEKGTGAGNPVKQGKVPKQERVRVVEEEITSDRFRELMRHITHPVVVVSSVSWPGRSSLVNCQENSFPDLSEDAFEEAVSAAGFVPSMEYDDEELLTAEELAAAEDDYDTAHEEAISRYTILRDAFRPEPRAMTVSSFSSLSLKPTPSVMFNISLPSHTYTAIATSHRFNVHVLTSDIAGANLAHHFAQGHSSLDPPPEVNGKPLGIKGIREYNKEWNHQFQKYISKGYLSRRWSPFLKESIPRIQDYGVLFTLRCIVRPPKMKGPEPHHAGGLWKLDEHTAIVVGDVEDMIFTRNDGVNGLPTFHQNAIGLSYVQKKYRRKGKSIQRSQV